MKTMSVKSHKIIWEDDGETQYLEVSTCPDNEDYALLTWVNSKTGNLLSQMIVPLQVAKSFHMVLRDF